MMTPIFSRANTLISNRSSQRGATLIVALIMLVMITMLALVSFNVGKGTLQIVGNMQNKNEVVAAAQEAVDVALSSTNFFENTSAVYTTLCSGTSDANKYCVDLNGDSTSDVTVTLTPKPSCVKVKNLKTTELDQTNAEEASCAISPNQSFGVQGANTGDSMCSDTVWEVTAVAEDATTQARVTLKQGVSVKVAKDDVDTSCS